MFSDLFRQGKLETTHRGFSKDCVFLSRFYFAFFCVFFELISETKKRSPQKCIAKPSFSSLTCRPPILIDQYETKKHPKNTMRIQVVNTDVQIKNLNFFYSHTEQKKAILRKKQFVFFLVAKRSKIPL